jgi:hypothetical protein
MPRSTWEQKLEQRLKRRPQMNPPERLVSDWLCDLMEKYKYKNFNQVSQHFIKCAMECLPRELWSEVKCPTTSIFGSWFRAESGVKQDWVDSIAYVRRVDEGLPATFSGDDVLLWIRNAKDPEIAPSDTGEELADPLSGSIVPTVEQISRWTEDETMLMIERSMAHWRQMHSHPKAAEKRKEKK